MNKLLVLFLSIIVLSGFTFAQGWEFEDVVMNGYSIATDSGAAKVNVPGLKNLYSVALAPDGKVWGGTYYSRQLEGTAGLSDLERYPDLFYVITPRDTGTGTYLDTTEYWVKPIFIYDPTDGSIDTIKIVTNPDASIDTLTGGHRGMETDHEGNIIAGFSNGSVYKFNYLTYDVMAKFNTGGSNGRMGVDAEGFVYQMDGVFASQIDIYDPDDWSAPYNSITGISAGVTRCSEVSPDGKNVYVASSGGGAHHYYSVDGVDGVYSLVDTIMTQFDSTNFYVNLVQWHPSGLLWMAGYDDAAPRTIFAVDPDQNYAIVDSLEDFVFWASTDLTDTTTGGYHQPHYIRVIRDAAFSPDGNSFYAADFYSYSIKKFNYIPTGIKPGEDSKLLPGVFTLYRNYPNPFNPSTNIPFELHKNAHVNLKVYDSVGRLVKEAINEEMSKGSHKYVFDGTNMATGAYFFKMTVDTKVATGRILLVK